MSNTTVECANCEEPTQQISLDEDGLCPRCATCRISSPPPKTPEPDVKEIGYDGASNAELDAKLLRAPLKSKIPIAEALQSGSLFFPPPSRVPADAEHS